MKTHLVNIGLYLMALVGLVDQASKWWLLNVAMNPPRPVPVTSFFNLVLVYNRGVTFGIFNHGQETVNYNYVFAAVAFLIIVFLFKWLLRATTLMTALGLGFVMGGATGNIIDRLQYGAVIDFLDFHFRGYHWYAFNVADAAVDIGVALLLLESFIRKKA